MGTVEDEVEEDSVSGEDEEGSVSGEDEEDSEEEEVRLKEVDVKSIVSVANIMSSVLSHYCA